MYSYNIKVFTCWLFPIIIGQDKTAHLRTPHVHDCCPSHEADRSIPNWTSENQPECVFGDHSCGYSEPIPEIGLKCGNLQRSVEEFDSKTSDGLLTLDCCIRGAHSDVHQQNVDNEVTIGIYFNYEALHYF